MSDYKPGDRVRKMHPYDGTAKAGHPTGPVLTLVSIEDQPPTDGPREAQAIARLSDGSWEFVWNLRCGHGGRCQ